MATGSIKERKIKNGKIHYEIVLEHGRDPITGKRIREYQIVKGSMREAKATLHSMISKQKRASFIISQRQNSENGWMSGWSSTFPTLRKQQEWAIRQK